MSCEAWWHEMLQRFKITASPQDSWQDIQENECHYSQIKSNRSNSDGGHTVEKKACKDSIQKSTSIIPTCLRNKLLYYFSICTKTMVLKKQLLARQKVTRAAWMFLFSSSSNTSSWVKHCYYLTTVLIKTAETK